MDKQELEAALETVQKAESEHPKADSIEFIHNRVVVQYYYYPERDETDIEPF